MLQDSLELFLAVVCVTARSLEAGLFQGAAWNLAGLGTWRRQRSKFWWKYYFCVAEDPWNLEGKVIISISAKEESLLTKRVGLGIYPTKAITTCDTKTSCSVNRTLSNVMEYKRCRTTETTKDKGHAVMITKEKPSGSANDGGQNKEYHIQRMTRNQEYESASQNLWQSGRMKVGIL